MVTKVNGSAQAGEFLGSNIDFFTFQGPVNILTATTTGGNAALTGNATTQANLDKLVEVVSLNGQPVIMGTPYFDASTTPASWTVKFATEHTGAWTAATLKTAVTTHAPSFISANAALIFVTYASTI